MTAEDRPDLGALYDEHMRHEFVDLDLDATMETMVDQPHTYFVPTGGGGVGNAAVSGFYRDHFIGQSRWPADWNIIPVSRTVGDDSLVEEFIVSFTHDVDLLGPSLGPGAGRAARSRSSPSCRCRAGGQAPRPRRAMMGHPWCPANVVTWPISATQSRR